MSKHTKRGPLKRKLVVAPATERTYAQAPPLNVHWTKIERWFIAVHKDGFGVDTDPATAILLAQESVPYEAKPSQLALYESPTEMEPTGFVKWPNSEQPRLIGLTNTHQGWIKRIGR
jgi:hypothetical protein